MSTHTLYGNTAQLTCIAFDSGIIVGPLVQELIADLLVRQHWLDTVCQLSPLRADPDPVTSPRLFLLHGPHSWVMGHGR
jgi:hypothetical protein